VKTVKVFYLRFADWTNMLPETTESPRGAKRITPYLLVFAFLFTYSARSAAAQYRLQIIASGVGVQDEAGHRSMGHAFMIITVPTRTGLKEDAFGFYPNKDGLGVIVGTPGALNSEWRKTPDRLAHAAVSLDIPIDGTQRMAIYHAMIHLHQE
jgi:hypothetical protein